MLSTGFSTLSHCGERAKHSYLRARFYRSGVGLNTSNRQCLRGETQYTLSVAFSTAPTPTGFSFFFWNIIERSRRRLCSKLAVQSFSHRLKAWRRDGPWKAGLAATKTIVARGSEWTKRKRLSRGGI